MATDGSDVSRMQIRKIIERLERRSKEAHIQANNASNAANVRAYNDGKRCAFDLAIRRLENLLETGEA